MAELDGPFPAQAMDHLAEGNMIAAIRIIRAESGLSLKDAKDAVGNYILSQPELAALYANRTATARRIALIIFTLAMIAVIAARMWFRR